MWRRRVGHECSNHLVLWKQLQNDKPLESGSEDGGYTRVQGNSKIAVAWRLMSECFVLDSGVDRHTNINIAQSIVYSCGSNLTRINYSGFYIAVLEKNDEVVCAATVRVHDKNLAEMPYIATTEEYRGQRMAHTLVNHIETVLRRLQVEKLVIPAVEELVGVWINKFGFSPVGDEQSKQELTRYNTVTFYTSVVRLQKNLARVPDLNLGHSIQAPIEIP
ncbi:hypothetical protein CCACVL1_24716 [Corchorus capsularis]|uniref:N-acetyltransferase domain-containing protein n=1 Tax=Corchorus capsularis TaxID=210143 RepID=A0A1R3GNM5_COCAP|nr:hypothetical protein CCACVL1_24716 [Corchorus capsularis]